MAEPNASRSIGRSLRALREARASTLAEMARVTRLSVAQLEALEAGDFSGLPAPVFVKGFIRAYCQVLGESPDEVLGRYREMLGERPAPEHTMPAARPAPAWSTSPVLISLGLLIVFGLGLLALDLGSKRAAKPVAREMAPAARVEPGAVAAVPAGTTGERRSPQRLVVRATEATWIRIRTDDGRVAEELLAPGATREWTSEKRFLLTVGNAGGIEIELNGRTMPPLGARGAVIHQLELPRALPAAGS